MRTILACAALLAFAVAGAAALEIAPPQSPVTDAAIIDSCGARLARMFAQFGAPSNLTVKRGGTVDEDDVFCDYGPYGFRVRNKIIRTCFFFSGWTEPIRGIKIGQSRDDVVKVMGSPRITVKDKEGVITAYGYDLNELDAEFYANFGKDGKVWRVEVSLK